MPKYPKTGFEKLKQHDNYTKAWQNKNIDFRMTKNQNKCWNNTGSPPASGLKKAVPKFLSVSIIVIAPAKTGSERSNRKAVISIDQTNKGILCMVMPGARMLNIVVMKFMASRIDEAPAKCMDKITISTAGPP